MTSLVGKVVIVTGAASGMGLACAELALDRGAAVLAVDRDENALAGMKARPQLRTKVADLSDLSTIPDLIDFCQAELGGVHGLVNSAGIFQTRQMLDVTEDDFDLVFAINVRALFFLQQAAARVMDEGSIVNFASTAARVARPASSHYAASKAAVVSLSRSAATAWGPRGIRVNSICPGVIATPMIDAILQEQSEIAGVSPAALEESWRAKNPLGRLGTPLEVAELVVFLLSDAAAYITGESIGVNGGADDI